ncbi:hypothetical protein B1218_35860, partial [Pseudomonas ogarae]
MLKGLGIKGRVLPLSLVLTRFRALVLGGDITWRQQTDLNAQLLQRGEMLAERRAPVSAASMRGQDT